MIVEPAGTAAFEGYTAALQALEDSFLAAGHWLSFFGMYSPKLGKIVHIDAAGFNKTIMIEGDSPAQAVKDVAAAIKL